MGPDTEKLKDSKLVMWFIGVVRVLDVEMEVVWRMHAALLSKRELPRPMTAASGCQLMVQLVPSPMVAVCGHGERRRPYLPN